MLSSYITNVCLYYHKIRLLKSFELGSFTFIVEVLFILYTFHPITTSIVVIVIFLIIIIWFGNCLNNCSYFTIWLTILKFKQSKMQSHLLINHALTSNH